MMAPEENAGGGGEQVAPEENGGGGGGGEQRRATKKAWSAEEDLGLQRLVRRYGAENWRAIGAGMPGRSAKSCRLRWVQHLDPRVDAARPFTQEEDKRIFDLHGVHGNRWSTIASHLHGRTDNAVKNRWNSVLVKRVRRLLPLFPLTPGDDKGASPGCPQEPAPEVLVSRDPTEKCVELDLLAPMDTTEDDDAGAAASKGKGMHVGADDPLTVLTLGPPLGANQ